MFNRAKTMPIGLFVVLPLLTVEGTAPFDRHIRPTASRYKQVRTTYRDEFHWPPC